MTHQHRWELRTTTEGETTVLEVVGDVDVDVARHVLEVAKSAVADGRTVAVHLDKITSLADDAATVLLFDRGARHHRNPGVILRTAGRPGRQMVLRAYARRRASDSSDA